MVHPGKHYRRRHGMQRYVSRDLPCCQRGASPLIRKKEFDMKNAICAMKAALGVRGTGGYQYLYRWLRYHNI